MRGRVLATLLLCTACLCAAPAAGAGPRDAPAPAPGSAPLLGQPAAAVAAMPAVEVADVAAVAPDGSVDVLAKLRPALAPAAAQAPAAPDASLASFAAEALAALAAAPAPGVGPGPAAGPPSAPTAARGGGAGSARGALTPAPAPAPASAPAHAAARVAPQASFIELAARVPVGAPAAAEAAAAAPGAGRPARAPAPAAVQPVQIVATEATAGKEQTQAAQTAVAAQPLAIVGDPCAVYDPARQGALHMNCQIQTALGVAGMPYTTHPVPRPVLRQAGHMGSFLQASPLAAVMVQGDQPYVSTAGAAIGVLGPAGVSVPAGPLVGLASHAAHTFGLPDPLLGGGLTAVYTPASTNLSGVDFSMFFYQTIANRAYSGILLAKNTYFVSSFDAHSQHLYFACGARLTPFTVDFGGSTLVFQNNTNGQMMINNCTLLTVTGATLYYVTPPFTQATIVDISPDQLTWTVQVHNGYPTDDFLLANRQLVFIAFDPTTRLILPNVTDIYPLIGSVIPAPYGGGRRLLQNGPATYQFSLAYIVPNVAVGDLIAERGNKMTTNAVSVITSRNVVLRSLRQHMAGVFCFFDSQSFNTTFDSNVVSPFPGKIGDGSQPALLSSNADGIHSASARMGPQVLNNKLHNMGDDGIAVHGTYFLVAAVDVARGAVTIVMQNTVMLVPGDRIAAYDPSTRPLGVAILKTMRAVRRPPGVPSMSQTLASQIDGSTFVEITVQELPPLWATDLGFDCIVADRNMTGDGYVLRGNTVSNNRGRGTILKGSQGMVENNRFTYNHFAGVLITSEIYNVAEADFSHEVTIRSNTIDSQIGGILVYYIQNGNYAPGPWPNHHTIEITNNTILNAAYTPVLVTSTTGVAVTGNTVVNALCSAPISGTTFGFIPKGALMFVENSVGVDFSNNTFYSTLPSCPYGNYAAPIQLGANVTDVASVS